MLRAQDQYKLDPDYRNKVDKIETGFSIIVAYDDNRTIGNKGGLPWPKIPDDMKFFQTTTTGHVVIMGRKTWDGLPFDKKPLPNRLNIVLSRRGIIPSVMNCTSIKEILAYKYYNIKKFIIGGEEVYRQFLNLGLVNEIIVTHIHGKFKGDKKFPELNGNWNRTNIMVGDLFDRFVLKKINRFM